MLGQANPRTVVRSAIGTIKAHLQYLTSKNHKDKKTKISCLFLIILFSIDALVNPQVRKGQKSMNSCQNNYIPFVTLKWWKACIRCHISVRRSHGRSKLIQGGKPRNQPNKLEQAKKFHPIEPRNDCEGKMGKD